MLKTIQRAISKRKLLKNMRENKEWKQYSNTPKIEVSIEQHKRKWDEITPENYQPLSDSINKIKSNYRHFKIDKEKLNKKLKYNLKKEIEISDIIHRDDMEKEERLMSPIVEAVNKLNIEEVERFKKINFIKEMKKKILEKEDNFFFNFVPGEDNVQNETFKKVLQRVKKIEKSDNGFKYYQTNINLLKNSKIDEFVRFDDKGDGYLKKYLVDYSNRESDKFLIEDKESKEIVKKDFRIKSELEILEEQEEDKKNDILKLSEENFLLAKNIYNFEEQVFLSHREFWANPIQLSKMKYNTQIFYIKNFIKSTSDIMDMASFYINEKKCDNLILPFFFRLGEICVNKEYYYEENEFLDIFLISDPKYKKILKYNLKKIPFLSFEEFSKFWVAFVKLHEREKGNLVGKKFFKKSNDYFLRKYNSFLDLKKDEEMDNEELLNFSLTLKALRKTGLEKIKEPELFEKIIKILEKTKIDINPNNSYAFTNLTLFIMELYKTGILQDNSLLLKNLDILKANSLVLINPINFSSIFKNLTELSVNLPEKKIRIFLQSLKNETLDNLLEHINIQDLSTLSDFMANSSISDFNIYNKIRYRFFENFSFNENVEAFKLFYLLNNFAYFEFRNKFDKFFAREKPVEVPLLFLLKNIFSLNFVNKNNSLKHEKFSDVYDKILINIHKSSSEEYIAFYRSFILLDFDKNDQKNEFIEIMNKQKLENFKGKSLFTFFMFLSFSENNQYIINPVLTKINNYITEYIKLKTINSLDFNSVFEFLLGYVLLPNTPKNDFLPYLIDILKSHQNKFDLNLNILINLILLLLNNKGKKLDLNLSNKNDFCFFEKYLLMFSKINISESLYIFDKKFRENLKEFEVRNILKNIVSKIEYYSLLENYKELLENEFGKEIIVDSVIRIDETYFLYTPIFFVNEKKIVFFENDYDIDNFKRNVLKKVNFKKLNEFGYEIINISFSTLFERDLKIKDFEELRLKRIEKIKKYLIK